MSKTSGDKRLLMACQAYENVKRALGAGHIRTRTFNEYVDWLASDCWARRKIYEIHMGRRFPDKRLKGNDH